MTAPLFVRRVDAAAFGERLCALRESRPPGRHQRSGATGMSQHRAAVLAGVQPQRWGQWERGERVPSVPVLARIAGVLALTDAELAALVRTAGAARGDERSEGSEL
jgi:transcriptional regulator with XRE-family HTH domain